MSEWQDYKVQEIALRMADAPFGSNIKNEDYTNDGAVVVQGKNIQGRNCVWNDVRYVSNEKYLSLKRHHASLDALVFPKVGTIGKVGILTKNGDRENYLLSTNTMMLIPDPSKADIRYVYYFFSSNEVKSYINAISSNSVQPVFNFTSLKNYNIPLPQLQTQKAIASILSSLDDKIDLLHSQNTTLERMAETLFRQWFVEEAQEDWSFVELGDYVNCFNGVSYKSSELNPSKVAMVTLKSFDRNGGFRLDGFKEFTGRFKEQHIVVQGDLVVAHTDITQDAEVIGNPVLVVNDARYEHMVISMDLVKVKSKYEWLSNEFLYRMMRTREFKEHCLGYSNGSTVLHLSKQATPSFEFFMPPKEKIQSYTEFTKDLFGKKFKNIEQILTLEKLRDNLLPKLMSGEIRIQNG